MAKIYEVNAIANQVTFNEHTYDNVVIDWFVVDRNQPILAYEEAIEGYATLSNEIRTQMENYINEKFTLEEANQLNEYLKARNNILKIIELSLPFGDYRRGHKDIKAAKGTGFYKLYKNKYYNLPFKVSGFFNVGFAEESITGDNRETLITKLKPAEIEKIRKASKPTGDDKTVGDKTRIFLHNK